MAKGLTSKELRELADKLDADERAEAEEASRSKLEELTGREYLSNEEVTRLREFFQELDEPEDEGEGGEEEPKPEAKTEAPKRKRKAEAKSDDGDGEEESAGKTRPGRKNGAAYNWWVDDDGEVYKLDVARIYTGEDEDDEVALPARQESEGEAA